MRPKTKTCFSHENSERQSSYSAALIGSNDDLLTEILLCLPVISVCRFKSISKHLRSLLSHTTFTLRYDTRHFHQQSPLGLFASTCVYDYESPRFCTPINTYVPFDDDEDRTDPPFRNLDSFSDPNSIYLVQSCNGLLLCRRHYNSKYYVCNPITRQFVMIPSLPGGKSVPKTIRFMGLAFHPTDCVYYKLVCILKLKRKHDVDARDELFQIQTYSSHTREWKISIASFSARSVISDSGVYWNGSIIWALSNHSYMYFKVDCEQLHLLPLPVEAMSSKVPMRYLGESRGHLHLIVYERYGDNRLPLKVYEMLMDHSGWFIKYHVKLDELRGTFQRRIQILYVIDVIRGEKDEDTFMVLWINGSYITYNIHDKSFKRIIKLNKIYMGSGLSPIPYSFRRYSQTLASL